MWLHVLCTNYMCVYVCAWDGQWGALVRSEFTVLMACGKKLSFSLLNSLLLGW